jgi:hypothetical protein
MKKLILSIALLVSVFATNASDSSERFQKAMGATLEQMKTAQKPEEIQAVANQFERIASAETAEWLPNYYAALCQLMLSQKGEKSGIDALMDKADIFIGKAEKLSPNNDEIEVLKADIAMMRISVDGMSRFMTYGQAFEIAIQKAQSINPENPRAYALKASMVYYTPEQFGGGAKNACPIVKVALGKFTNFKATYAFAPTWGEGYVSGLKCE